MKDFQPARHETHCAKLLFRRESGEVSQRPGLQVPAGQQVSLASLVCRFFFFFFFLHGLPARTKSYDSEPLQKMFFSALDRRLVLLFPAYCLRFGLSHLTSNCSPASLSKLSVSPKFLLRLLAGLDASQFDMRLLLRDDHNLSCWQMLPHYHSWFVFVFISQNVTIAPSTSACTPRRTNEWNRNSNI